MRYGWVNSALSTLERVVQISQTVKNLSPPGGSDRTPHNTHLAANQQGYSHLH
ncbi:MAG: hypothetical protein AAFY72_17525 [Cyanobacteria bacterium J06649_4]